VALTHKEIFERYLYAGAITRNPDAIAAMFTEDGVYDAPLVPGGHPLHRLVGRDAIRTGTSRYHQQQPTHQGTPNLERSAYLLHDTLDPDIFIAEIDVAFDEADGRQTTMSLVWIFRLRDGQIAMLRDYFAEL
jgi:ketosteroid isomerase-like protein